VSLPLRFLHALSQAFSASTLYAPTHPARQRSVRTAFDTLRLLQAEDDHPSFSFLGRDVIYGYDAVRELRDWDWSTRLAAAGIQRIEVAGDITREDFDSFINDIQARLTGSGGGAAAATPGQSSGTAAPSRQPAIRFGAIGVQGAARSGLITELPKGIAEFTLREEASTIRYIHEEVTAAGSVPMAEAEAVVRSLSVALHADGRILIPMLRMKSFDQYTTTHSINVAVLTMALAEAMGHSPRDVRTLGVSGLLHDLGKVRVPKEILTKPGSLSPEERELLERHPGDGARLILNSDSKLTVPAAVAWEHHIMINGGGYPHRHFARECHYASTLVHVCDVFDALHTDRPYRDAWPAAKALHYIERRAGREFDPIIAAAFISLMRQNERAVGVVDEQTPVGQSARAANGSDENSESGSTPGDDAKSPDNAADETNGGDPATPPEQSSSNGQPPATPVATS
jgi:putative nucleotidyltransferase with HDIG domain